MKTLKIEEEAKEPLQALMDAGADYEVKLAPVFGRITEREESIPENRLSYRIDAEGNIYRFGVVGSGYTPVNNLACLEAFDALRTEFGYGLRTIHHTRRGILALLRQGEVEVVPGDPIGQDIIITTDHGGRGCVRASVCSVRKVNNAMLYGTGEHGVVELRAKHTTRVSAKLVASAAQISTLVSGHAEMLQQFKELAAKPFVREAVEQYLDLTLGPVNGKSESGITRQKQKREEALAHINAQQFGGGSWWQVYNGLVSWLEENLSEESALIGSGADKKRKALEQALLLAR